VETLTHLGVFHLQTRNLLRAVVVMAVMEENQVEKTFNSFYHNNYGKNKQHQSNALPRNRKDFSEFSKNFLLLETLLTKTYANLCSPVTSACELM
jgi:hypothetical protein